MTDSYEEIRKALAMGPTPGPWYSDGEGIRAIVRDIRELLDERDQLAAALEAARDDGARLRETLRDVTGVAICCLFDTHREDTIREFSLQELARVTEVTYPLMEEVVTVEAVYRRGYDAAINAALSKEKGND